MLPHTVRVHRAWTPPVGHPHEAPGCADTHTTHIGTSHPPCDPLTAISAIRWLTWRARVFRRCHYTSKLLWTRHPLAARQGQPRPQIASIRSGSRTRTRTRGHRGRQRKQKGTSPRLGVDPLVGSTMAKGGGHTSTNGTVPCRAVPRRAVPRRAVPHY